ncbi:MAG: hypothetical protein E6G94_01075 [Alphaproteobacteria bacterium]|nr:MAG: hypothetical protein E6G94_01075 [Alphaproteobacteria bacterium]
MNPTSTLSTSRPDRSLTTTDRVARGLGWFSIGLGLVEIIAPGRLGRALGLEGRERLLQAYGGREIGAGVWALSDTPAPAIWARVGGDLLDLATLAVGLRDADSEQKRNAIIALAAVAGITVVDLLTAASLTAETSERKGETGRDYSDRSGFPQGAASARGAAEGITPVDFQVTATPERAVAALEPAE